MAPYRYCQLISTTAQLTSSATIVFRFAVASPRSLIAMSGFWSFQTRYLGGSTIRPEKYTRASQSGYRMNVSLARTLGRRCSSRRCADVSPRCEMIACAHCACSVVRPPPTCRQLAQNATELTCIRRRICCLMTGGSQPGT